MTLYEVTLWVKKDWMDQAWPVRWGVCASGPDEAIDKIKNAFDLDGVEIKNEQAIAVNYVVVK